MLQRRDLLENWWQDTSPECKVIQKIIKKGGLQHAAAHPDVTLRATLWSPAPAQDCSAPAPMMVFSAHPIPPHKAQLIWSSASTV